MTILAVGSVAYDSVKTPHGSRQRALGGSATYFSVAASYFSPVNVVAVVGEDFTDEEVFARHGVGTNGLSKAEGNTFRWVGEYSDNMNQALTLDTQLNVFADFKPILELEERRSDYLFLGNIDPVLQYQVLQQMDQRPKMVAGDTMNFWIEGKPDALLRVIGAIDTLLINEGEVKLLAKETNLVKAARIVLKLGPQMLVVKRGEYGAIGFTKDDVFAAPAYPLEVVVDPTGAGDTFAGGFVGYLAACGNLSPESMRRAMVVGSLMASFAVESFGLDRLHSLTACEIHNRYIEFHKLTYFHGAENADLPTRVKSTTPG